MAESLLLRYLLPACTEHARSSKGSGTHAGLYAYSLYAYAAQQQRTYPYPLQPPRRTPIIIIIIIIIIIRPHSSIVHDMVA